MSYHDERLYLTDIVDNADAVARYLKGKTAQDVAQDAVLRDALLMRLIMIGESAARLSEDSRQTSAEIPWNDIIAFRQFATYYNVGSERAWNAAQQVPPVRRAAAEMLQSMANRAEVPAPVARGNGGKMIAEIERNRKAIAELCHRYHVRELSVFGSAVRDDFRPESDIDLLVEFEPGARIGLLEYCHVQNELSDLLGRKVDLVDKRGLKPVIKDRVLAEAQHVFAR